MSQFSRKYYKNEYKLDEQRKDPYVEHDSLDKGVWTFWRVWGLYEYLVLALLMVIIFLLLYKSPLFFGSTALNHSNSYNPKQTLQQHTEIRPTTSSFKNKSDLSKQNSVEKQSDQEAIYFAKKVLPQNPLPQAKKIDGEYLYGPVTMQDYLYFADAVDAFYPDSFDTRSRTLKSSSCKNQECTLTPELVDEFYMAAYSKWLENTTTSKSVVVQKDDKYYIKQN